MKPIETIEDAVTGKPVPLVGAEENRQMVARLLMAEKGFAREEIRRDVPIAFEVAGEAYRSTVDMVISAAGRPLMVIKCAAGSLGSREREAVAAARLVMASPLPVTVVSDGRTAHVLDTVSGKLLGEGLAAIPTRAALEADFAASTLQPLEGLRLEKERLVFRSYDSMDVNVARRLP